MEVIDDVTACQSAYPDLVLTVGSFDGVHLGHRKILQTVIERARATRGTAALMSLWPHPKAFFNPHSAVPLLSNPAQKTALLEEAGLDVYFILPFTEAVAHMEAGDFLTEIILGKCAARRIVVGHDFSFGAGARGDYALLESEGRHQGLAVEMVPPVRIDGERVSSTLIRKFVLEGDLERAHRFLGRPYTVSGTVIRGRGMGAGLGYPTANIQPDTTLLPAYGIYAARVRIDGRHVLGAVNIGIAPTIPHTQAMIEVHLLDFEGELGGHHLDVELHHRLRPEKKFEDLAALKAGIETDIVNIRQYFERNPA